jgi:hypothetical protein
MSKWIVFKSLICVLLCVTIFIAGCGGAAPNPVDRYMPGDEKKSCRGLFAEMDCLDQEVTLKNKQKDDRDFWNIVWFTTGFLVIVPWFFIDCKGTQEVEIAACQQRRKNLKIFLAEKDCAMSELVTQEGK